ncbi:hypothetical protein [Mycobacterium sp. MMS18-G62]
MIGEFDTTLGTGNRVLRAVTTPVALVLLAALVVGSGSLAWQRYHRPCVPASAASSCVGISPESASGPLINPQPNAQPPAVVEAPPQDQPRQPLAPNGQPPIPPGLSGDNGGVPAQLLPGPADQPAEQNPAGANPIPPPVAPPPVNPAPPEGVLPVIVAPPLPVPQGQAPVPQGQGPVPQGQGPVAQGQAPVAQGPPPAQPGQPVSVWGGPGCLFKARDDPTCWTMQKYGPDGRLTPVNTPVVIPPEYRNPAPAQGAPVLQGQPPAEGINCPPNAPCGSSGGSPQVSEPLPGAPPVSGPSPVGSSQVGSPAQVSSSQESSPVQVSSSQVSSPAQVSSSQVSSPAQVSSSQVSGVAPLAPVESGGSTTTEPGLTCYGPGAVNCH